MIFGREIEKKRERREWISVREKRKRIECGGPGNENKEVVNEVSVILTSEVDRRAENLG